MVWEEMSIEEFQDGRCVGHLGYRNGTILTILNLYVTAMPPIKFRLTALPPIKFRLNRLKKFKMAAMAAILDIGTERF